MSLVCPVSHMELFFFFFFLKVIFSHLKEHVSAKTTLRFILIMRFQRFFETKHRQEGAHTHTESVRKSRATSDHTEGSLSNSRSTQQQPHGLIETDRIQKGQESKSPVTSPQRPPCCLYPTGPKWFEPTDLTTAPSTEPRPHIWLLPVRLKPGNTHKSTRFLTCTRYFWLPYMTYCGARLQIIQLV